MRKFTLLNGIRRAAQYFFSREVPVGLKVIPILAFIYLLSPIDVITDLIPVLGLVDDVGFLAFAISIFNALASQALQRRVSAGSSARSVPVIPDRLD